MNTYSYLKATADSIANRWHQGLIDLKEITHTPSRADHIDYLRELYQEAEETHELYSQHLHPVILAKLTHIIGCDFDRHINLSRKVISAE